MLLEELILEIFILVLIIKGIKTDIKMIYVFDDYDSY